MKAVNVSLTIRNWLIGYYIVAFELNGEDRAKYGDNLFNELSIKFKHIKGIDRRSLYRFKDFYKLYPHLQSEIISHTSFLSNSLYDIIVGTATPQLIIETKVRTESRHLENKFIIPANKILQNLSYSHIEQLLQIEDDLKRGWK